MTLETLASVPQLINRVPTEKIVTLTANLLLLPFDYNFILLSLLFLYISRPFLCTIILLTFQDHCMQHLFKF